MQGVLRGQCYLPPGTDHTVYAGDVMANRIVPKSAKELATYLDRELVVIGRPAQRMSSRELSLEIITDLDTPAGRKAAILEKKREGFLLRLDEGIDSFGIDPENDVEAWVDSYEYSREAVNSNFGGQW
jgi:hypothetical protein